AIGSQRPAAAPPKCRPQPVATIATSRIAPAMRSPRRSNTIRKIATDSTVRTASAATPLTPELAVTDWNTSASRSSASSDAYLLRAETISIASGTLVPRKATPDIADRRAPRYRPSGSTLAAGAAQQSCLDLGVRRLSSQPDRKERLDEIVALDRALVGAVDIDLHARAGLEHKRHP